jgi:K+-sensing histidine kinase KdpD
MLIAAPVPPTLLIASRVGPAVPLRQNQGFFPPQSRTSNRQWAAWVLATRLGMLLRYHVLPSECCLENVRREGGEQAMTRIRWRAVVQCSAGSIAFELLTFACLRLRLDVATAGCISLIIVVLSLRASLLVWAVGSFIAVSRLAFFFAPRILSFRVNDPTEAAAILAFLTTPVVPTKVEAHE